MKTRIFALAACFLATISSGNSPAWSGSLSLSGDRTEASATSTSVQDNNDHAGSELNATAAESAAEQAWQSYQSAIADALIASNRPRDWALAANMLLFSDSSDSSGSPSRSNLDELLERAARDAPDDVLVQWMTALKRIGASGYVAIPASDESIQALIRLEPDNAASWMMGLALALKRNDPTLAEDALAHMASSARYDDHFADTLHAWLDVTDRFPPSNSALAPSFNQGARGKSQKALQSMTGFLLALAQSAATAMPRYQPLTTYCKPGTDNVDHWPRFAYCEDAGRLMLGKGETLIARLIGFAILRNLGRTTAVDQQEKNNLSWYIARMVEASAYESSDNTAIEAYQADWRNLDDEIEIRKRALRRAGLPDTAPAGWIRPSGSLRKTPPG